MNHHIISKTLRGLFAALFIIGIAAQAEAGPGPQMYLPVKTMEQAKSIKAGDRIAVYCGNCGGVTVFTAGADRGYLRGYTCPSCKLKFVTHEFGGHGGSVGSFVYESESGKQAKLLRGS